MPIDEPFATAPRSGSLAGRSLGQMPAPLPSEAVAAASEPVDGWVELDGNGLASPLLDGELLALPNVEVVELSNLVLRSCRLVTAPDAVVRVRGCVFENCDLAQVRFKAVTTVRFEACRMTGLSVMGELSDTEFRNCRLHLASVAMSAVSRVRFDSCELVDSDFVESQLSDVSFDGSRLVQVGLHRTTFARVDLRGAQIESLTSVRSLQGCLVSPAQVHSLAPLLAAIVGLATDD